MSIVLVRVDSRLIHGQVLEAWVPHTSARCIVVMSDDLMSSPMEKMIMEASVPSSIKVFIGGVTEMVSRFKSGEFDKLRTLVLFANSQDVLSAYRDGFIFNKLNLGNMHAGSGKVPCSCTIYLDPTDIENLNELVAGGVEVGSRCVPTDTQRSYKKMIPKGGV